MTTIRRSTRTAPARTSNWCRPEKRAAVYALDSHECLYCGCKVARGDARGVAPVGVALASLDHIVPVALGGSNGSANLVTACVSCNAAKNDSTVPEFLATTARGRSLLSIMLALASV